MSAIGGISSQHRHEQTLGGDPDEDGDQHEHGELDDLPDEPQVAPVAANEVEREGDADRDQRKKQEQANDVGGAPDRGSVGCGPAESCRTTGRSGRLPSKDRPRQGRIASSSGPRLRRDDDDRRGSTRSCQPTSVQ